MPKPPLYRQINSRRVLAGIPVDEIARETGIHRTTISALLNGTVIRPKSLTKVSAYVERQLKRQGVA